MKLKDAVDEFLGEVNGRLGEVARANGTFFACNVVTTALQRIRLDVTRGASVTESGHRYIRGAAAYLALLAANHWNKCGLAISGNAQVTGDPQDCYLRVCASRVRESARESYEHDFLRDTYQLLIDPPQNFPYLHGQVYVLNPLVYPSPEYLYLYGMFLLQSPRATGNWPMPGTVGGLEQDFRTTRARLVEDLHKDVGLPVDDKALSALSWWVVFPPYGWQMNEGQGYNMMTLVDQIGRQKSVSREQGIAYLRALLNSQLMILRNLAARTLMVLGEMPQSVMETNCYQQALAARDREEAAASMAQLRWSIEGKPDNERPAGWAEQCQAEWQRLTGAGPQESWRSAPILADPEYLRLAALPREQRAVQRQGLEALHARQPRDWYLRSALGATLMEGPDPARGEQMLRECIGETSDCPDAHFNLGTRLKWRGRRDEAMAVFEDAVRRWPRNQQGVDSCMWLLTDPMVSLPQ